MCKCILYHYAHIDLIAHMAKNPANETADFPQLQTLGKKTAAIVLTTAPQVSWLNRETTDEFQAIFFHSSLPRKKKPRWNGRDADSPRIWKLKSLCWINFESSFQQNTYSLCDSIEGVLHHCYQVVWYTSSRATFRAFARIKATHLCQLPFNHVQLLYTKGPIFLNPPSIFWIGCCLLKFQNQNVAIQYGQVLQDHSGVNLI